MIWNVKVFGIVQGVGFRPFISRLASAFSISGSVANRGSYVEIFAQGENLAEFVAAISKQAPERSAILKVDVTEISGAENFTGFEITESVHERGDIFVSPDIAICENCAAELFNPSDRRYLHPFINCTACGPRLTILKHMPYDRERTSMSDFPMCESCAAEYFSADSRRFDAQPICCHECGPEIYLIGSSERGGEAIRSARKILAAGGIVAVKGLGGFHLACDARNFDAVQRLRENKFRPAKPFAVMFKNLAAVQRECILTSAHKTFLDSPQKPIVLLEKNPAGTIAENVAPEINRLGALLPYTPVHLLLFGYPDALEHFPDALVMTSGNPSGVPIAITDADAQDLPCDAILSNNREILLRADDSVMDFVNDTPSMIRRSRGYAPLPIFYDGKKNKPALAIGGELKNTFCLAKNNLLYASPYIGDVSDLRTVEVLKNSIRRMSDLLEIQPEIVACDLHPRYQTTKLAEEFNLPVVKVQHHYAHILSCVAENNFHGEVIGVAFDGTGYGDDGTIWGGEFFICDARSYRRVGHIAKFVQAGGDKSAREGWRIALAMADISSAKTLNLASDKNLDAAAFLLKNNLNCVTSTSCGRLFDAVSAILGICKSSSYEGEAAMKLQTVAENSAAKISWQFEIGADLILPTDKLFAEILSRRLEGGDTGGLARFFHESLAEMTAQACEILSARTKIKTVALSGGVFQNSLLTALTIDKLNRRGLNVLRHKFIPANDGGLCIGQALKAQSCL
ncbi:MAG: carbamoyltransferase HypF [Selenomonadaceae bacterium]|nr:carbamoyltransferase HypF [Selenomonadaceae bacterium]